MHVNVFKPVPRDFVWMYFHTLKHTYVKGCAILVLKKGIRHGTLLVRMYVCERDKREKRAIETKIRRQWFRQENSDGEPQLSADNYHNTKS